MMDVRVAQAAVADIERLLEHSSQEFGDDASRRYERLIGAALGLLGERAPALPADDALPRGFRSFHLMLARRRARAFGPTVRHPRHFLVWRFAEPDVVEVARVLHESTDIAQHLPTEE
jgi:toxin ParE1/3/4